MKLKEQRGVVPGQEVERTLKRLELETLDVELDEVGNHPESLRGLRDALDVVPALETAVVLETREGNRPASDDLRPFFEVLGDGRWAWSSGHFRHGVTLAPIAAGEVLRFAEGVA